MSATNDLDAMLSAARSRLQETAAQEAEAEARHTADADALAHGRSRLADAAAEVARLSGLDDEAVQRHARRLEQDARAGRKGPLPLLQPSDEHLAKQIAATRTHAAAVQMVASLEQAEKLTAEQLAAATAAHRAAASAVMAAEKELLAEKVLRANDATLQAGAALEQFVPHDLNIRIGFTVVHSERVQQALTVLKRLKAPTMAEELNKPLSELRRLAPAPSNFLAERRDALMAEPQEDAAA
jgi:ribosome assembly protein YihI (activator of Der GTPase)